ncbi:MAG: methyl-accepting chemotaxis protein [Deltaproteobacteria bacterium]|nr:methyl-accepting chemotaxis protein [Deltaproteobacteria bacterium]
MFKNTTIGKMLTTSAVFTIVLVGVVAASGIVGMTMLSNSLKFITTKAWDAADGAMEGTIGIQQQMIAAEEMSGNHDMEDNAKRLSEGKKMADEALDRMVASGLVPEAEIKQLNDRRKSYQGAQAKMLASSAIYNDKKSVMNKAFLDFQNLLNLAEELGDAQVEELEKNPGRSISWNGGLKDRWAAADGPMEFQISLLARFFNFQRMESGAPLAEVEKRLNDRLKLMEEIVAEIKDAEVFQNNRPGGAFGDGSFASLFAERMEIHKKTFSEGIAAFKTFHENEELFLKAADELKDIIEKVEESGDAAVESEAGRISVVSGIVFTVIIVIALVAFLLSAIFGISITRAVKSPIIKIMNLLGDASSDIIQAADTLAQSSQSLASGATEQAANIEEISATVEEMSAMTARNADSSMEAEKVAEEMKGHSQKGTESMTRMIDTIGKIKQSSDETAKIIKTIDEIAFQTNLLALNAAVEAARAGDAGRGFAVVAEEVRNLAMRSAEAARNTSELLEESQNRANQGVNVASETEAGLSQVNNMVNQMLDLVRSVATATREQKEGLSQINNGVSQVESVAQSNAAFAEENASSGQEMSSQASKLSEVMETLELMVGEKAARKILRQADTGNGFRSQKPLPLPVEKKMRFTDQPKSTPIPKAQKPEQKQQLKSSLTEALEEEEARRLDAHPEFGDTGEMEFKDID